MHGSNSTQQQHTGIPVNNQQHFFEGCFFHVNWCWAGGGQNRVNGAIVWPSCPCWKASAVLTHTSQQRCYHRFGETEAVCRVQGLWSLEACNPGQGLKNSGWHDFHLPLCTKQTAAYHPAANNYYWVLTLSIKDKPLWDKCTYEYMYELST